MKNEHTDQLIVAEVMDIEDEKVARSYMYDELGNETGVKLVPVPKEQLQDVSRPHQRWAWNGQSFEPETIPHDALMREAETQRKLSQSYGFQFEGKRVAASSESLASIASLRQSMEKGALKGPVTFKTKSGLARYNAEQVTAIQTQAQQRFQKCLDVQMVCQEAIERGEVRSVEQITAFYEEHLGAYRPA